MNRRNFIGDAISFLALPAGIMAAARKMSAPAIPTHSFPLSFDLPPDELTIFENGARMEVSYSFQLPAETPKGFKKKVDGKDYALSLEGLAFARVVFKKVSMFRPVTGGGL